MYPTLCYRKKIYPTLCYRKKIYPTLCYRKKIYPTLWALFRDGLLPKVITDLSRKKFTGLKRYYLTRVKVYLQLISNQSNPPPAYSVIQTLNIGVVHVVVVHVRYEYP